MLAAFMAGIPIRMHDVVGLPLMEKTGLKFYLLCWIEKLVYACAKNVYPNSYGLKDYMIRIGITSNKKLKVLGNGSSNGIDTSYFSKKMYFQESKKLFCDKWIIKPADFVYLFIGRLVGDKGVNELITAFNELSLSEKNIKLVLVGSYEKELDPLHKSTLNIIENNPQIISTGYQENVRPYYANASCFVFPSYREGFPNVILEALSMEIPCIVSDINGSNEVIDDEINGLIIPTKSSLKLRDAMIRILKDNELRNTIIKNSRNGYLRKI